MPETTTQPDARRDRDEMVRAHARIAEALALIAAHNDDHFGMDPSDEAPADWGAVGSAYHAAASLEQIVAFLGLKKQAS